MKGKVALIVGASGLVGRELLKLLLAGKEYGRVGALVRKPLGIKHPKLEERIIDFDNMDKHKDCFLVNDVFCCIGTTIKKARSREEFKKIDVDYPVQMAKISKELQVEKFLIITSVGADSNSMVYYSRMKGLLEKQLSAMGLNSLHIFRPSLLLGARDEYRLGEEIGAIFAKGLSFAFVGPLKKYKAIDAKDVAMGMYITAQKQGQGAHVYLSHEISKIAHVSEKELC